MIKPDRVQERLDALGITRWEAASLGDFERAFVNDIISGRKKKLQPRSLRVLARVLQCSPEYLTGDQDNVGTSHDYSNASVIDPAFGPSRGTMPFAGVVESGALRRIDLTNGMGAEVLERTDPRFDRARQAVFACNDDALSGLHIVRGDLMVVADFSDYSASYGVLRDGHIVVLERRTGEYREIFARLVEGEPSGRLQGVPRTDRPGYETVDIQQLPGDPGAVVLGIVVKVVRVI